MADRLREYRRKRDAARTPEPVPERTPRRRGRADGRGRFVIQQHHARRLHWDLRLERDGVLVSWAVPRGLPRDQGRNHLAVRTEDHPMEYLDFHGEIPAGEYGGGRMTIHDRGTYRCEKWRDDEVVVVLAGQRTRGRYVLFATGGKDWMVRRTDPPPPGWTSMPGQLRPMRPTRAARLPTDAAAWGYELRWDGVLVDIHPGGRVRPPRPGGGGRADPTGQYLLVDLLWLDGAASLDVPYAARRELLDGLTPGGPHWQTTPWFPGAGAETLAVARAQGLPGILAKRLDSTYEAGRRSPHWLSIDAG